MTQEAEIVVNGETVGYGLDGMLAAYERMVGGSMNDLVTVSFVMEQARSDAMSDPNATPLAPSSIFITYSDEGKIHYYLVLPQDVLEEMGNPSEITVTVEPGDALNG